MTSNVIQFPKTKITHKNGYRINLYTEHQIYIVLMCINLMEDISSPVKYMREDLRKLDPEFVMSRLHSCLDSTLLSKEARGEITNIIDSIEVFPISALS